VQVSITEKDDNTQTLDVVPLSNNDIPQGWYI